MKLSTHCYKRVMPFSTISHAKTPPNLRQERNRFTQHAGKCWAAAAPNKEGGSDALPDPFAGDPELKVALDDSVKLINDIVAYVCNTMVSENAVAYVTVSESDANAQSLVTKAVQDRLEEFNQMTLHTLHSMLATDSVKLNVKGNKNIRNLLTIIKSEILRQTGTALPDEILLLDSLIKQKDEDERLKLLQDKSEKQLEALALAAGQVIGDMEDTPAIADVPLLCSAVLVKDEVIAMLEHKSQKPGQAGRMGMNVVPEKIAAIIKELMRLQGARQRQIMLFSVLKEGCQAPSKAGSDRGLKDAVRPGMYLHCLDIIRVEMELNPPDTDEHAAPPEVIRTRLQDLKADSLKVIRSIQNGKLAHLSE